LLAFMAFMESFTSRDGAANLPLPGGATKGKVAAVRAPTEKSEGS
jgi:hypothetical protein